MEYRLFEKDAPKFHDSEFYKDRPVSDHITEPGHMPRLNQALREVQYLVQKFPIHSLVDLGAGNGGFLNEVRRKHPHLQIHGYDMQPSNIEWAREKYGVKVYDQDIGAEDFMLDEACNIFVLTETLEHLVSPHGLLRQLVTYDCITLHAKYERGPRFIVASSPAFETPEKHYEFHLWAWTEDSFPEMFRAAGWKVEKHFVQGGTQFVVASLAEMSPESIEKTRKRVIDYLTKTESHKQRIVEVNGYDVAGYFAMGHHCFAQVDDPEIAIAAQKRYPWLTVSTRQWEFDADVIIRGEEVIVIGSKEVDRILDKDSDISE